MVTSLFRLLCPKRWILKNSQRRPHFGRLLRQSLLSQFRTNAFLKNLEQLKEA